MWLADAGSSAVRAADVAADGEVRPVVGTGPFDSGGRDGVGDDARRQHPQGVAVLPDGGLLVADSYDDALRRIDPTTRRVETRMRGLHEPGGLTIGGGLVYVADTNAHRVLVGPTGDGEPLAREGP